MTRGDPSSPPRGGSLLLLETEICWWRLQLQVVARGGGVVSQLDRGPDGRRRSNRRRRSHQPIGDAAELAAGWRKATLSIRPNLSLLGRRSSRCRRRLGRFHHHRGSLLSLLLHPAAGGKKRRKGGCRPPSPAPPVRTFAEPCTTRFDGARRCLRAEGKGWSRWKRDFARTSKERTAVVRW